MRWMQSIFHWLRSLFLKRTVEQELSEEVRFHVERQIEENVAAGMPKEEARRAALREFGGVELAKEECRDARGTRWLEDLLQDVRFAARTLRQRPGFVAVALLTLA